VCVHASIWDDVANGDDVAIGQTPILALKDILISQHTRSATWYTVKAVDGGDCGQLELLFRFATPERPTGIIPSDSVVVEQHPVLLVQPHSPPPHTVVYVEHATSGATPSVVAAPLPIPRYMPVPVPVDAEPPAAPAAATATTDLPTVMPTNVPTTRLSITVPTESTLAPPPWSPPRLLAAAREI